MYKKNYFVKLMLKHVQLLANLTKIFNLKTLQRQYLQVLVRCHNP